MVRPLSSHLLPLRVSVRSVVTDAPSPAKSTLRMTPYGHLARPVRLVVHASSCIGQSGTWETACLRKRELRPSRVERDSGKATPKDQQALVIAQADQIRTEKIPSSFSFLDCSFSNFPEYYSVRFETITSSFQPYGHQSSNVSYHIVSYATPRPSTP